jgi:hypothetical protein
MLRNVGPRSSEPVVVRLESQQISSAGAGRGPSGSGRVPPAATRPARERTAAKADLSRRGVASSMEILTRKLDDAFPPQAAGADEQQTLDRLRSLFFDSDEGQNNLGMNAASASVVSDLVRAFFNQRLSAVDGPSRQLTVSGELAHGPTHSSGAGTSPLALDAAGVLRALLLDDGNSNLSSLLPESVRESSRHQQLRSVLFD